MNIHLFVKYEDIEKYNNGEEIVATDLSGKSIIFKHRDIILPVDVDASEVIRREDLVSRGMTQGTFNKYIIKKSVEHKEVLAEVITKSKPYVKEPEELLPNGTMVIVKSNKNDKPEEIVGSIASDKYPHRYQVTNTFGLCELKDFKKVLL